MTALIHFKCRFFINNETDYNNCVSWGTSQAVGEKCHLSASFTVGGLEFYFRLQKYFSQLQYHKTTQTNVLIKRVSFFMVGLLVIRELKLKDNIVCTVNTMLGGKGIFTATFRNLMSVKFVPHQEPFIILFFISVRLQIIW